MTKDFDTTPIRQHKLFWGSSYDRGIQHLLKMWPKIKETYPNAELHIAYGWVLFDAAYTDNKERQAWKQKMQYLMQHHGITEHGRLSKQKLAKLRKSCGIWAYPTDFGETNCITALDCQRDGVVPCVINKAGLRESVQSGVCIEGDIYDEETQEEYLEALLDLMGDAGKWQTHQEKGIKWAKKFTWDKQAVKWTKRF